jgi:hypothetical protein
MTGWKPIPQQIDRLGVDCQVQTANRFAFKEWAVVCAALAAGRQSLILRKGGIHEGRDGFRVDHPEFWLFPTQFHQSPDEVIAEALPLLQSVRDNQPPDDTVHIRHYAVVHEVRRIDDESLLPALRGFHVWSDQSISQRFHYRTPGLFALLVRVYVLPNEIVLPNSPHFAGCRSWVDLPDELLTSELQPVLSDSEIETQLRALLASLSPTSRSNHG